MAKPVYKLVDERVTRAVKVLEGIEGLVDGITAVLLRNAIDELDTLIREVRPATSPLAIAFGDDALAKAQAKAAGVERVSARADVRKRQAQARKAAQA